jgi:hypothetical protein
MLVGLGRYERMLFDEFKASGLLKGTYVTGVHVGFRQMAKETQDEGVRPLFPKEIDAICVEDENFRGGLSFTGRWDLLHLELSQRAKAPGQDVQQSLAGKSVSLLEIKRKLDCDALGKIFVYNDLFLEDNPSVSIKGRWIVCHETDRLVEHVAKRQGINVCWKVVGQPNYMLSLNTPLAEMILEIIKEKSKASSDDLVQCLKVRHGGKGTHGQYLSPSAEQALRALMATGKIRPDNGHYVIM